LLSLPKKESYIIIRGNRVKIVGPISRGKNDIQAAKNKQSAFSSFLFHDLVTTTCLHFRMKRDQQKRKNSRPESHNRRRNKSQADKPNR